MSSVEIVRDSIALDKVTDEDWPAHFHSTLTSLVAELRRPSCRERVSVQPLRELHRPFSTLLHVRIFEGTRHRNAFIKILQPRFETAAELVATRRNVQREYDITSRVADVVNGVEGLSAVRTIACFPEDYALVTEEVEGITLSRLLSRRAAAWPAERTIDELSHTLRRTANWLRVAQQGLHADRDVSVDTITRYLDRRLNELSVPTSGLLTPAGRACLQRYRDHLLHAASRDGLHAVWIHADFCPDNIIVSDSCVSVIDFTMANAGTRYHDLAHLFLGIDALRGRPWFTAGTLDVLQTALLDGFEPGLDGRHPLFMLARFQHVLCHLVALQGAEGPIVRLRTRRHSRRYCGWLSSVAGLGPESWHR
jgi:hypothetical protein